MDKDILKVLTEAGDRGLSLQKIVLYAYNSQNSLFQKYEKEEVKGYVIRFLRQNTRYPGSLIQKISRGVYRLNPNSDQGHQLLLNFEEEIQEQKTNTSTLNEMPHKTLFDDIV
ncbi:MAG: hypothetical protein HG447_007655 [Prevotella sp.]|nr:hypothetical protein [Prevotella sp.]